MIRLLLAASLAATLTACGGNGKSDGGTGGGGGGTGGGNVTCSGNGVCAGAVAEWCPAGGTAGSLDCSMIRGTSGALEGATCSTASSFGAWCAVGTGKTCLIGGQARSGYLYCGDSGGPSSALGCDLENGCTQTTGSCTFDAGTPPTCQGSQLVVDCTPWGQPVVHTCTSSAIGGSGCQQGACVGVDAGLPCDATRLCGDGLACDATTHACIPFTPGQHPTPPQVISLGGSVLTAPKVLPITWSADPNGTIVDGCVQEMQTNPYWAAVTGEYGVGALTKLTTQHPSGGAPASFNDMQAQSLIAQNTSGTSPAWGAADPQTIYMVVIPQSTTFDDGTGSACCTGYGGYHGETVVGSTHVPYAIICECPDFDYTGEPLSIELPATISHELVEAATDPYTNSAAAYAQTDDDHAGWTVLTGGEVADMCTYQPDFAYLAPGFTYVAQRSWSNAAASAGKNPCIPRDANEPFANAAPVISATGTINYYGNWMTKVVHAALNSNTMVDVQAWSNAPMGVPFSVTALDVQGDFYGGSRLLNLTLDNATANNGDTLHLTVHPVAYDNQLNGALFMIRTDWDGGSSLAVGTAQP